MGSATSAQRTSSRSGRPQPGSRVAPRCLLTVPSVEDATEVPHRRRFVVLGGCGGPALASVAQKRNDEDPREVSLHPGIGPLRLVRRVFPEGRRSIASSTRGRSKIEVLQEHAVHNPAGRFCSRPPAPPLTLLPGGVPLSPAR